VTIALENVWCLLPMPGLGFLNGGWIATPVGKSLGEMHPLLRKHSEGVCVCADKIEQIIRNFTFDFVGNILY
jgi:hypothetical protein